MAYQENKPEATDTKNVSQGDMQGNFQAIKTLVDVDHKTFADANEGKHVQVTLPEAAGDPVTAADEMALYTKVVGGATAMFLRNEGAGDVVDFTTATPAPAVTGTTTLPCGITMKWGTGTATGGGAGALNTFIDPFGAAPYSVVITEITNNYSTHNWVQVVTGTIIAASFRATSFDGNGNNSTSPIYYVAFGR